MRGDRWQVLIAAMGPGVAVVVGSGFGIGLNLLLPFLLPLEEYAIYSLLLGLAQLVTSLVFEWMRVALLRNAYGGDLGLAAVRRAALAWAYLAGLASLLVLAVLAAFVGLWANWVPAAALVLICGGMQGVFEGQVASARARFDHRTFARRWLARVVLGMVLALAAALTFGTGVATLMGVALSYPLAMLGGRGRLRWSVDRDVLWPLFQSGAPAAVATNLCVAVPAMMRSLVVASLGPAGAAGMLLALDLGQRLFSTLGMAVNVVVTQRAIQAVEHGNAAEVVESVRAQVLVPLAVIGGAGLMFLVLQGQIAELIVPANYRGGFAAAVVVVIPALMLLTVRQYGLDPLFVIFDRPGGAMLAPVVVLLVLLVAGWIPAGASKEVTLLLAAAAGFVASLLALLGLVPRFRFSGRPA